MPGGGPKDSKQQNSPPKRQESLEGVASPEAVPIPGTTRISLDIKIEGVTADMLHSTLLDILLASGPGGGGEAGSIGDG